MKSHLVRLARKTTSHVLKVSVASSDEINPAL
jgi:hypothetical protein